MDTASNCEAYMSRLFRKDKSSFPTSGCKANASNAKIKSNVNKNSVKSKSASRPPNPQHNPGKPCANCNFEGNTNVQKEIYIENPITQIPTKISKPRSRSNAAGDREPWGKLLKSQNSEKPSKFSNFDPLRTLHFLAKELQFKLQSDLPDDNNLQQIVLDMQHALTRVPPEIASAIQLQISSDTVPLRKTSSSSSVLHKKFDEEIRVPKINKSCQTIQKYEDTELIQKIMEGSTQKLEASCRQMEMLCGRLKNEKDDLEEQLRTEKDNVKFLKKRVGDLEIQCDQLVSVTIKRLEEEKNELQLQVNKLTDIVDSQSVQTNYELKNVSQELKQVQMRAEQECTKLKHQLALANMEREKYIAILTVRDRQISEIRTEMSQLQDVVNEQLMDIHNNALSDLPSTQSFETDDVWMMRGNDNGESDNNSNLSLINNESQLPHNFNKVSTNAFPESSTRNHDANSNEKQLDRRTSNEDVKNSVGNKQSIRNMFAELKKQAFAVTSMTLVKP